MAQNVSQTRAEPVPVPVPITVPLLHHTEKGGCGRAKYQVRRMQAVRRRVGNQAGTCSSSYPRATPSCSS